MKRLDLDGCGARGGLGRSSGGRRRQLKRSARRPVGSDVLVTTHVNESIRLQYWVHNAREWSIFDTAAVIEAFRSSFEAALRR
jgi:hypothetical protein